MTKLEYYGHSCFRLTAENGYRIVFDPYEKGSVPGLELPDDIQAEKVICSHAHADHNASCLIHMEKSGILCPYEITQLTVPHDHHNGTRRGLNHLTILQGEENKIVHFGDLGRMLSEEEADAVRNANLIMIPCGGYFTIDASEALEIIQKVSPRTAILMHYRRGSRGYDVTASISEIQKIIRDLVLLPVDHVSIPCEKGIFALEPIQ